jgi:hypothetical protein
MKFNKFVPRFLEETPNPDRGDITSALEAISTGTSSAFPASILRGIARTFEASNALVARRFLGRSDGKLFADVNYEDESQGEPLTLDRTVEIAAHLWCWRQREVNQAKREIARLEAKLSSMEKAAQRLQKAGD